MGIKSQKDFFSGLMFLIVGGAFAIGAYSYGMGDGARMGPGYFPRMLGVLLAVLGSVVMFKSLTIATASGEKIGKWAWRPLFFILSANLLFGVCLGGLKYDGTIVVPTLGMVIGIFLLVGVAAPADKVNRPKDMFFGSLIAVPMVALGLVAPKIFMGIADVAGPTVHVVLSAALLTTASFFFWKFILTLIFPNLHKQEAFLPLLSVYSLLNAGWFLFKTEQSTALFIGDLLFKITFLVCIMIFSNRAFVKLGFKNTNVLNLGLLTTVLILMSVWAFIDGLRLQIPLWPSFIA